MNILGIETSCDETSVAVVQDGKAVLSNVIISSLREHAHYGGVIPEIASRRQLECITAVCQQALAQANVTFDDIDAIAVTSHPGLIGSLLVGISFARSLSYALGKPLIYVDHIEAHAYANFLTFKKDPQTIQPPPTLPAVALVVSGGHTNLYHMKSFKKFRLLGQTRDDAAGEAFDKVAKILDLGYPGGPVIDQLAKTGRCRYPRFKCASLPNTFDFSFSGIKTAVLYHQRDHKDNKDFSVNRIAYAFQESVISILVKKCLAACQKFKTNTLLIGGGVAANSSLRQHLKESADHNGIHVYFPPMSVCTDNAAMIAGLGFHHRLDKERSSYSC